MFEIFFKEEKMNQLRQVYRRQSEVVTIMPFFMGVLTLALFILVFVGPGWTGEKGRPHVHNPEKQLKKLTERLGLTEVQQAKIKPLLEQKAQQLEALHQQMKDVRQKTRAQIESELTAEQISTFNELREKRKEHKKSHKGNRGKGDKGKHNKGGYGAHEEDHHEKDD